MGADAVLLVHEHRIVDERRSTPLLLDDDGVVWAAKDEDGGVDSVTLQTLVHDLRRRPSRPAGPPERTPRGRATAMVLVGTGLGVASVEPSTAYPLSRQAAFVRRCRDAYERHMNDPATWTASEAPEHGPHPYGGGPARAGSTWTDGGSLRCPGRGPALPPGRPVIWPSTR